MPCAFNNREEVVSILSDLIQSPKVYTVSDLTAAIQDLLEEHFDFVWV